MKLAHWLKLAACWSACVQPLEAQSTACAAGRGPGGDVGVRALRCTGPAASCAIWIEEPGGFKHSFAVEPTIVALHEWARDQSSLRVGDVLVAVDGLLITTVEGGRRLARLTAGAEVSLTVRRAGRLRDVKVETQRGCGVRSLTVSR